MLNAAEKKHSKKNKKLVNLRKQLIDKFNDVGKFEGIHGWLVFLSYYADNKISIETKFLNYRAEFELYCQFLKSITTTFKQRFLIHGKHWNCGEVRIDENANISFFLFDSLPIYLKSRLDEIERVFSDRSVTVYIPNVSLQRDTQNCAIFAIDGWRRLEKVGDYLPEGYSRDLFEYFKLHSTLECCKGNIQIYKAQLPLYLMKLMQSRTLVKTEIPSRADENKIPFNHKNEIAEKACLPYFRLDAAGDIFLNDRVLYKKAKFIERGKAVLSNSSVSDEIFMKLIKIN